MSFRSFLVYLAGVSILFVACDNDKKQSNGPIILGDSSTIVTETDPRYLNDFVDDIQLQTASRDTLTEQPQEQEADTAGAPVATTAPQPSQTPQPTAQGKGLNIPFKDVTVFIPGVEVRTYRKQNLENANGASYQIESGKLDGNQLQLSGATITKVSQRYIATVIAKNELGTLVLDALSNTTDWEPLKGNGKTYTISGLNHPQVKNAAPAQIKAAVDRAARNKRVSRLNLRKWEDAVRNVKTVNQSPLSVVLRSVMWKIEGKDANGKLFQKQVRIDLPI